MEKPGYIPAFDGLRAVAIISVLLFHVDERTYSLGWTGIILFFVLSGYLITGILLDSKGEPHYFRNFYVRRTLRIFPAYYLLLLLTFLALYLLAPSHPAVGSGATEWSYFLLYVQNYWMGSNSFRTPLSSLLAHTWTLAIEEQFYLIWPVVVYLLNRKALGALCLGLLVISPIVRIWTLATTDNPFLTLATLPGQCDALALGALIAVLSRSTTVLRWIDRRAAIYFDAAAHKKRWCIYLLLLSLVPVSALVAGTGWQAYVNPDRWLRSSGNFAFITLLSLFFAALLLAALNNVPPLSNVLGSRFPTHIGRISYGIYLYHILTFNLCDALLARLASQLQFLGKGLPFFIFATVLKFVALYVIAISSYRYVERPFLALKSKFA